MNLDPFAAPDIGVNIHSAQPSPATKLREPGERLRGAFTSMVMHHGGRSPKRDYALYASIFATLPRPVEFWERLASSPVADIPGVQYRFMAAVRFLLLKGDRHPVRSLFSDLSPGSVATVDPNPGHVFQDYVGLRWEDLVRVAIAHEVQINKLGRCALFMPLFAMAYERGGLKDLHMIDVGASAGFGMLWPMLGYDYGRRGRVYADVAVSTLHCRVRGGSTFRPPAKLPPVARQVGLDTHPIDVNNKDDAMWLTALTAPNNLRQQEQLQVAVNMAQCARQEIRIGCALETLETAFRECGNDTTCVISHSLTKHHLEEQGKWLRFVKLLQALSSIRKRPTGDLLPQLAVW